MDRLRVLGPSSSTSLAMHLWVGAGRNELSWNAHSVKVMLWATQSRPRANSCFMSMIHSVSSASSSDAPAPHNLHCEAPASNLNAKTAGLGEVVQVDAEGICWV